MVLEGGDSGPLELPAAPGLMMVVDLALYRSLEGELTPTICSAHALLTVWIYVKEQTVLASSSAADCKNFDSFLQVSLDASSDAIEKLLTWRTISRPPSMADGPSANHGILFTKSVAASLPHSRFSWFSCCFRVVHLVMQGKDAD